jgi:hypothetical protein
MDTIIKNIEKNKIKSVTINSSFTNEFEICLVNGMKSLKGAWGTKISYLKDKLSPLSTFHYNKNKKTFFYALFKKNKLLPTDDNLSLTTICHTKIDTNILLNLYLKSIPNISKDSPFFAGENISLISNFDGSTKDTFDRINVVDFNITQENIIKINATSYYNTKLVKKYNNKWIESKRELFSFDHTETTLSKSINGEYVKKRPCDSFSTAAKYIDMINISNYEKFIASKIGAFSLLINIIKKLKHLDLKFEHICGSYQELKDNNKHKTISIGDSGRDYLNDVLKFYEKHTVNIFNYDVDIDLTNLLSYLDSLNIKYTLDEQDISEDFANIFITKGKDYYTNKKIDDPYNDIKNADILSHFIDEDTLKDILKGIDVAVSKNIKKKEEEKKEKTIRSSAFDNILKELVIKKNIIDSKLNHLSFDFNVDTYMPFEVEISEDIKETHICKMTINNNIISFDIFDDMYVEDGYEGDLNIDEFLFKFHNEFYKINKTNEIPLPDYINIAKELQSGNTSFRSEKNFASDHLMQSTIGIFFDKNSKTYFCGSAAAIGASISRFSPIINIETKEDSVNQNLFKLLNKTYVKNKEYTSYPITLKYIREYLKQKKYPI